MKTQTVDTVKIEVYINDLMSLQNQGQKVQAKNIWSWPTPEEQQAAKDFLNQGDAASEGICESLMEFLGEKVFPFPVYGITKVMDVYTGDIPQDVRNMMDLVEEAITYRDTNEKLGEDMYSVTELDEAAYDDTDGSRVVNFIERLVEAAKDNDCAYIRIITMP